MLSVLKIDSESQIEVDVSSINLSPIRLDVSNMFTMTEPGASEEKEVQVDEDCFEPEETSRNYYAGPLWSDFDYTPVIGEDGEEVMDGETQTQDGSEPGDPEFDEQRGQEQEEGEDDKERAHDQTAIGRSSRRKKIRKSQCISSENLLETPSSVQQSSDSLASESAVQCSPESYDMKIQTSKFKKKKKVEKNIEAKVEMSTSTVQATTEMCEQSAGSIEDDWLQVNQHHSAPSISLLQHFFYGHIFLQSMFKN